jgi:hypothetical protein
MPNSKTFELSYYMRLLVRAMMKRDGRNFKVCELCRKPITGKFDLHHTKYEGATYRDLLIVHRRCNLLPENVGLI